MALSYRKYTATNLAPQLVTSNVIDPNTILGLHQGSNGFANLIICIAEAWYLESIRELAKNNRSAIINNWQTDYKLSEIGQPWCEIFVATVISEAIKQCNVTNLYPKANDKGRVYFTKDNKAPAYNWELSNKEIQDNGLKQVEDVVYANAFRASIYLNDKLYKTNRKIAVTTTPIPGSRFYRYSEGNGSSGHAGIVIAIKDGYFYTIEGNVVIDNGTKDEGVGMYRYPMAAAQSSETGFTFFDFSKYPSAMGNISCENQDYSYTYTGLDGKTKTRKCYKPPTPPKDVVETPTPDKKETPPPPKEEPKKDPCVPVSGIFTPNDPQAVKEKKCSEYITLKVPDTDLLQNYVEMKNPFVARDITKSDVYGYQDVYINGQLTQSTKKMTAFQIALRNGSALWYKSEKEDTKKATGFGMFKDRIGNIIYVLDANNPESEQLAISGLLGFNLPNEYVKINEYGVKTLTSTLGKILYKHRSLCNLLMIGDLKANVYDSLRDTAANKIQVGSYEYGNGFYNSNGAYKFGEKENNWITWDSSYGLDFQEEQYSKQEFNGVNGNVWKYQIPLKSIQDAPNTKNINIYKLMSEIEKTGNGLKLSKPIIILVDKVVPPPPLISQDFISILKIAGSLTALVGIPLPMDAILSGASFASQLENIQKNGFSNPTALLSSAFNFTKGVIPDSIKGLEKDAMALLKDNVPILEEQLKNGFDWVTKDLVNGQEFINQINNLGGAAYAYGKNAYAAFDGFKKLGDTSIAEQVLGIKSTQLESLRTYYTNIGSGIGGVYDMRDLLSGFKFKDVQLNMANLTGQLASKAILTKLNSGASPEFISQIINADNIADVPLIQEIILNGGASKVFGMFPKAPELATGFIQSRIKKVNETEGKLRSFAQDQRANIIAAGMGYDLKICDIFSKETQDSLVAQAKNYATANVPFFLPPTLNGDVAECYKYEIQKRTKATVINCPPGWNYDVKTNRCYNETTSVGYDGSGSYNGNIDFKADVDVSIPKCIQSSFGTYVFYFRGIPLAAMRSTDGRWIAAWGGKNYFIDINNCTLLGVPPETTDKPNDLTPTPPAIALPKCITIRNGKYYYNLRYALGLNDGLISKELTDLFANTKTPIGGATPQELVNIANSIGLDTSKVTNNPTVSSATKTVDKVDNLINTLKTTSGNVSTSPVITTSSPTGSPITNPISTNPVTVTAASSSTNPVLNVTQAPSEEEAFYMNGKWYLLRNGKYVEIIDCLPKQAQTYKCGIIERDGEFIFTKNGAEYKAVKNFDNDFYVFINGSYYQLDANCNPIIPQPSGKECAECEVLVNKEQQNRIKLEKAFSESKISNDSKIKELMNLLNIQTQKSLELEKQMILRSGSTSGDDTKYNELLSQLQSERERVNQLSKMIEQSKTGGNNNDSVIREIITSLNQEKERSQKLEQKISELEQMKKDSSNSTEYFNNLNNVSKESSNYSTNSSNYTEKTETLPNCITKENGKYYFTGLVQSERLQLMALNTAKGWVASYQNTYYLIDLANCTLLISKTKESIFTGECTDCVQNTQPRIVERNERIVYGGFKQGLDPETYEDCEEC